jgi:outer membrane murein-binding lipoprotein Lpp
MSLCKEFDSIVSNTTLNEHQTSLEKLKQKFAELEEAHTLDATRLQQAKQKLLQAKERQDKIENSDPLISRNITQLSVILFVKKP